MEIQIFHLDFGSLHAPRSLARSASALIHVDVVGSLSQDLKGEVFFGSLVLSKLIVLHPEWVVVVCGIDDAGVQELHQSFWFGATICPSVLRRLQAWSLDRLRLRLFTSLSNLEWQLCSRRLNTPLRTKPQVFQHIMSIDIAYYHPRLVYATAGYSGFKVSFKYLLVTSTTVLRLSLTCLLLEPTTDWVFQDVIFLKLPAEAGYIKILY